MGPIPQPMSTPTAAGETALRIFHRLTPTVAPSPQLGTSGMTATSPPGRKRGDVSQLVEGGRFHLLPGQPEFGVDGAAFESCEAHKD